MAFALLVLLYPGLLNGFCLACFAAAAMDAASWALEWLRGLDSAAVLDLLAKHQLISTALHLRCAHLNLKLRASIKLIMRRQGACRMQCNPCW